MSTLYKSLTKLPDSEKIVYYFDKNGNRQQKTVKVTDRYLLVNAKGDSIACTKKYLAQLNINAEETSKVVADVTDDEEETTNNVTQSSPNSTNGENKNG
ncbi:MAG: hypothetical protein IKH36_01795 [Bacilli bacterium]|nr:hypothetical protein [Bacilli bacterium]